MPTGRAAPGEVALIKDLAEVGAGNELAGGLLRREVAQRSAQQAHTVRAQRSLPKLVYDAQRPALRFVSVKVWWAGNWYLWQRAEEADLQADALLQLAVPCWSQR